MDKETFINLGEKIYLAGTHVDTSANRTEGRKIAESFFEKWWRSSVDETEMEPSEEEK